MEVETFAHGALCVCYSGQCFMSSLIGGRSANRGMCAQACRLPYELRNASLRTKKPAVSGEHLLSPRDLCSIDLLSQLVDAGVSSLKIEGRMKSADYVYSVVSVYRAVLDRVLAARGASEGSGEDVLADEAEKERLAAAFSRGFTTAYLEGDRGNDIMSYQRPNNRGQFIGRVAEVKRGEAKITTDADVAVGDVIEFWTKRGHTALTVSAAAVARGGAAVSVPLDEKTRNVRAGDRVFRVRSVAAAFADDELGPRVPLVGRAELRIGSPLRIEFDLADPSACADDSSPASRRDLPGDSAGTMSAVSRRAMSSSPRARDPSRPTMCSRMSIDWDRPRSRSLISRSISTRASASASLKFTAAGPRRLTSSSARCSRESANAPFPV